MKFIRLGSLSLIFFFGSIIFINFLKELNLWGMTGDENLSFSIFLSLVSLFPIIFFWLGTTYTIDKIEQARKFKFALFNFILIFFSYVILLSLPFLAGHLGLNFNPEGGAIFLMIWLPSVLIGVPILVFIFSYLPSLFLRKFYGRKILNVVPVGLFIAGTLILMIGTLSYYTCNFGHSTKCKGEKAVNNLDVCEKEATAFSKCLCYSAVVESAHYSKDLEPCRRYDNLDFCSNQKGRCVMFIAGNSHNINLCSEVNTLKANDLTEEQCRNGYQYIISR